MKNSEILYLYDAKLTNPNGDPDEENRPRMDGERDINLVSDLRMKRYIRDYLLDKGYDLFVRKIEDKSVTAEERIKKLLSTDTDNILKELIDVRMFGATIPVKKDNKTFIGPIQFNWGYSLNKVELVEASITSHFASSSTNTQGAIGKDYRVKYSLIAFCGVISGRRAEKTKLTQEDINLFDEAMKKAIPLHITRSKVGQYPRLYLRVQYKDEETILGDLRSYIDLVEKDGLRDIKECTVDITRLLQLLKDNKDNIELIKGFGDPALKLINNGQEITFTEAFKEFNIERG